MSISTHNIPVIVSSVRTPIGKFNKSLKTFSASQLGAIAIKEAIKRIHLPVEQIEEVIMGNVLTAGIGQAPARQASIFAELPYEIPAVTINKVCGSGLKAILLAAQAIKAGDSEVIVAGGQESMTNVPFYLPKARFGHYFGHGEVIDGLQWDGLRDAYSGIIMGMTGEIVAERYKVTREDADKFSLRSHELAVKAQDSGYFKDEIIPIEITDRKGNNFLINKDDGPRSDSSLEKLARLKPAFKKDGIVTAGNASTLNDGASAVIVMSLNKANEIGLEPLATIRAYNTIGVKPELVMEAPIHGSRALLEDEGLKIDDFDLVEHNEAFASASVAVQKELSIPDEVFNVNGGAVALGHPLGCSGTRITNTMLNELNRRDGHRGLLTICLGGGNAVSMIVER
ncbi:MAG: thiolase family protein [Candidatus Hodarchaeales archaeon]